MDKFLAWVKKFLIYKFLIDGLWRDAYLEGRFFRHSFLKERFLKIGLWRYRFLRSKFQRSILENDRFCKDELNRDRFQKRDSLRRSYRKSTSQKMRFLRGKFQKSTILRGRFKRFVAGMLVAVISGCLCLGLGGLWPEEVIAEGIDGKRILVIGSYSMLNEWEQEILKGFNETIESGSIVNVEHLDSNAADSEEYYNSFMKVLNMKYKDQKIDCLFLMDDEAVNLARSHLFDEDAFCYRVPMVFVGVNDLTNFSEEEKKYISGIVDIENSLNTIDVIISTQPDLKTIYLLTDESQYCRSMEKDIENMPLYDMNINIHIIRITDTEALKEHLSNLDEDGYVLLLSGTYSNVASNSKVPSKDIIEYIKSMTDIPIYTTLYSYVKAGAIGGIINDGEKLGQMGAGLIMNNVLNHNNDNAQVLVPIQKSVNVAMFNFKSIREYGINPGKCPPNSIFIEKPFYEFLIPEYAVYALYISLSFIIILIVTLSILAAKHKKNAKAEHLKLIESQEREAIKTDYIIIMSHEFRTPLNIIKSVVELIKLEAREDRLSKEYLLDKCNMMIKNADRLNRTINHSIDVSKLESGLMSSSFKMYNVVEVIENITDNMVDYARENNVEVVFDTNEEEVYSAIDKKAIDRIMLNLLSNAVKSIEGEGRINVNCIRNEKDITISVKDTGVGMSTEAKDHIFEKFYQVRNSYSSRSQEGNGLGLFIVKHLVEMHKGAIAVESRLGEGTTFTIILPITIVDEYPDKGDMMDEDIDYLTRLEFSDLE